MIFPDNHFDLVYSHGVLHHTTNMQKAFNEVYRIIKPGGQFILMLYAKSSFNYWIRIQFYFRLRLILTYLLSKLGIKPKAKLWKEHLENLNSIGWSYLSWKNFPHRCTDGANCKIAFILSKKEGIQLLKNAGFKVLKTDKAHFPIGAKFPKLERFLARFIGFHQFYWLEK